MYNHSPGKGEVGGGTGYNFPPPPEKPLSLKENIQFSLLWRIKW